MVISVDAEKAFDEIQHPFMIEKEKTLQKVGMEGTYLNMLCVCQSLSRDLLFAIPWTVACQAPLSMELSRQEYWSGLLCPSPGDLPNPGIEPSLALQADSLTSEPAGKPKKTGVGRLSLLQGIFPTHESNPGLLHGRWTVYQLSYQGSPCCRILPDYLLASLGQTYCSLFTVVNPLPTCLVAHRRGTYY